MSSADDDPDTRALRKMEQRLATKEVQHEWRLWTCALIAVIGMLAIRMWLAPVFFLRGFN